MKSFRLSTAIAFSFFVLSCGDDDSVSPMDDPDPIIEDPHPVDPAPVDPAPVDTMMVDEIGEFELGVFIVNEGNFGSGNASVDHWDSDSSQISNGIFQSVNGLPLGDVAQSLTFSDSLAYIVVNNSSKIEVVEYADFTSIATISDGLANPRYLVADGSMAYVSNWGTFDANFQLDQSYIGVFDLNDNALVSQINTHDGSENLHLRGDVLYVSNNFVDNVQVIDLTTQEVTETITVGASPSQLAEVNGQIWVMCTGSFGGNDGQLVAIDPDLNSVASTSPLGMNPGGEYGVNSTDGEFYYYAGTTIYTFDIDTKETSTLTMLDGFVGIYSIGYDESGSQIYVGDAVGFMGQGQVRILGTDGSEVASFQVGVGPTSFVFTP